MQLAQALRLISQWKQFSGLEQDSLARLAEQLQPLRLRPDKSSTTTTSGVALVAEGQMRLLALDEREEPLL